MIDIIGKLVDIKEGIEHMCAGEWGRVIYWDGLDYHIAMYDGQTQTIVLPRHDFTVRKDQDKMEQAIKGGYPGEPKMTVNYIGEVNPRGTDHLRGGKSVDNFDRCKRCGSAYVPDPKLGEYCDACSARKEILNSLNKTCPACGGVVEARYYSDRFGCCATCVEKFGYIELLVMEKKELHSKLYDLKEKIRKQLINIIDRIHKTKHPVVTLYDQIIDLQKILGDVSD